MRILGPELRRGTGTQNSCQVARAHRDCWRGSEYGNETWGPESVLCGLLLVVWWGLGRVSTIEICTHQDSRMSDGRRTRPACHYCQNVQSSVGGEIKHWVSLNNHKLVLRNAVGYPIDPFPMNIRICIREIKYRDKTSPRFVLVRYWCNSARCSIWSNWGHCGRFHPLRSNQVSFYNPKHRIASEPTTSPECLASLGVFAKAKIKYFEFLTQYSSRRSRVKSDRR